VTPSFQPSSLNNMKKETRCASPTVPSIDNGGLVSAIQMSSSFCASIESSNFSAQAINDSSAHLYGRWSNPTVRALELDLAQLEGGADALCFGSGMAAISGLFLKELSNGDHVIVSDVCYAGVPEFVRHTLKRLGIDFSFVNTSRLEELERAIRPTTKLVHVETPCNPILRLTDIKAAAEITHRAGAKLSVDSTMATPIATQPLLLGADYVVHSLTKYISGHGDSLGGVVVGHTSLTNLRKEILIHLGAVLSPFNAWLISRGLSTLPCRMLAHATNAQKIAEYLEKHPAVKRVNYPGLTSHPQHALAESQMDTFSGSLSFILDGSSSVRRDFVTRLRIFHYAVSLGKTQSLIFYLPTKELLDSSYLMNPEQEREYRLWAGDGVFRLSTGIENSEDLIADLHQALPQ